MKCQVKDCFHDIDENDLEKWVVCPEHKKLIYRYTEEGTYKHWNWKYKWKLKNL